MATHYSHNLRNALTLMRIPFSLFLMPIYFFALTESRLIDGDLPGLAIRAFIVFVIFHLLIYPASNGYNSLMDKDEGSIGGLKNPPPVNKELWWFVVAFDLLSVVLAFMLNPYFALMVGVYLMVSKAYSWHKIRLKKYPIVGTLTVVLFQGAFTFITVQTGLGLTPEQMLSPRNLTLALVSTLFLAGSYPMTQIYQHREDKERGDTTISSLLGIQGTFIFTLIAFVIAVNLLFTVYYAQGQWQRIAIFVAGTLPVIIVFLRWFARTGKNPAEANFENTMRLNAVSGLSLTGCFIAMLWY